MKKVKPGYQGRYHTIIKWLNQFGELSTRDIYELFIDNEPKKTPTMFELANMLGQHNSIEKVGHTYYQSYAYSRRYTIWTLKEEVV